MQINDSSGAIDITTGTIRASIRKTADAATVEADVDITIVSAVDGSFLWEFSASSTAAITADPVDELAAASTYVWDMEIEFASGRIIPLLYGTVNIYREVTKP